VDKKEWIEVKDLKVGDRVLLSDGKEVAISGIRSYNVEATKVYNFEVADNHTYFVGEDGVLVHNYLIAGGPSFWSTNSEWGNSVMEFLGLKEPMTQLAAKAATNPVGTAKDVVNAFVECDSTGTVSCGTVPGIGGIGKAGKALQKIGSATDDVVKGSSRVSGEALKQARSEFENIAKPNFWKNQAVKNSDGYSPSNLKRMQEGKPPIGSDGYPMELLHKTPLAEGGTNSFRNLKPLTRTEHRLGENYKKNHPNLP
jgi:hypothetical protein